MGLYRKYKPHMLLVVNQLCYTFLYFMTEAAFNLGMNPHVYVTYRALVAGIVMLPFAYFLERDVRPKLTITLFLEIFMLSLLGVSLSLNVHFDSLKYSSPTFLTAMTNTTPSLTFIFAVALRLEVLNRRDPRSIAKVLGTMVSLGGVITMTTYKGPIIRNLWHPLIQIQRNSPVHENWLKASLLTVSSCIIWATYNIMQALTLKRYHAELSLTVWMSFVGAAQSAIYTVIVAHKPSDWIIGFNIEFWSTIYSGVVTSGVVVFFQLWCTKQKGPVFITIFNPLCTVLVAMLAYFVFGEKLYLGRIIGAVIVIIGLYLLLWGKEGDNEVHNKAKKQSQCNCEHPESRI
ncbi:hypothetical protein L6164_012903 [Bauhinia variegata]|uniref:Uncharacterized protein n=1 Tax=Bauhinia variegata TaxID=167791 RepID=A0ACB9PAG9_BAUVA|nr:hypothetical protein L6164_012903 [Bauhinia variegata]